MYASGDQHFYVLEFARLKDGSFVVPIRWATYKGQVMADAYYVDQLPDGAAKIDRSEEIYINASNLEATYPDLVAQGAVPRCNDGNQPILSTGSTRREDAQIRQDSWRNRRPTQTERLRMVCHSIQASLIISVTTYLETVQSRGTSTGTPIALIGTSPERLYHNRFTCTSSGRAQMQRFRNNCRRSLPLSSESYTMS